MNKRSIIISMIIGGAIGLLIFNISQLSIQNEQLIEQVSEQDNTIECLQLNNEGLIDENKLMYDKVILTTNEKLLYIEPLKKYNKQEYLHCYKNIMKDSIDIPETIYDETTDEEFRMLCCVVQEEIGNGNFDAKCNVSSSIINRYLSGKFPNGWKEVLFQKSDGVWQYSTVGNGSYRNAKVTKDTIEAIEYAWSIGDTTNGCTYFHSGISQWHKNNLEFVFNDGYHSFYREKEK